MESDLDRHVPQDEIKGKYPLEGFFCKIADIRTSVSSSGNKYTAVILPDGKWIFTWWDGSEEEGFEPGTWAKHLTTFKDFYIDRETEVVARNSNYYDDGEDPFWNLEYVTPQSQDDARKLFDMMQKKKE